MQLTVYYNGIYYNVEFSNTDDYILDRLEEFGLNPPFSGRSGTDSSSTAKLEKYVNGAWYAQPVTSARFDTSAESYLTEDQHNQGFLLTDVTSVTSTSKVASLSVMTDYTSGTASPVIAANDYRLRLAAEEELY